MAATPAQNQIIRFCIAEKCQSQFFVSELTNRLVCPKCGAAMHGMSKIEMDILPADTEGTKEKYQNMDGRQVWASIVLSGKERASIHRPEVCLTSQGNAITRSEVIDVPLEGRAPLRVKVLELAHQRDNSDGSKSTYYTYYAYWFAGKGRETPEHWQRMRSQYLVITVTFMPHVRQALLCWQAEVFRR